MTKWVFRKEKYYKDMKGFTSENELVEQMDGLEATFSNKANRGKCRGNIVFKDWCEEVKEMTRMHEILGVEPGEVFGYKNVYCEEVKYNLDAQGNMYRAVEDHKRVPSPREIVDIINHPERIIRKPRLTGEQIELLKALKALGCKWVTQDDEGRIEAWETKPVMVDDWWVEQPYKNESAYVDLAGRKAMLISPILSYTDPLSIDAALGDV